MHFLGLPRSQDDTYRFSRHKELPDSVVDGGKGQLLSLEGLANQIVRVDYFLVVNILQLLCLYVEPQSVQNLNSSASSHAHYLLQMGIRSELRRVTDQSQVHRDSVFQVVRQLYDHSVPF